MKNNKSWMRGKKKLSPEQKVISDERQRNRTKVANFVARNKSIDRSCVICGKPGRILHNENNPYFISFICNECSKDKEKLAQAANKRVDIKKLLENRSKKYIATKSFPEDVLKQIVENYINSHFLYVGEYCQKIGISRYQFNKALEIYDKKYPKNLIYDAITNRLSTLQRVKTTNSVKIRKLLNDK